MANAYDVIIIGSGPGGYIAAIRAAQLGLKTAVVEREHLAGICSNWGCIPTKALLRTAEVFHYAEHAKNYGFKIEGKVTPDVKAIVDRSRGIAQRMNNGVGFLMKKNKVDVIWGEAKLTKPGEIVVSATAKKAMQPQPPAPKGTLGEGTYSAKHVILATVVELMSAVMPVEDAEVSKFAQKQFEKQGMKIILEAKVTKVEKGSNSITAHVEMKDGKVEKITADRMISAVGVQGNIENLGLDALGVNTERGCVDVDG